MIIVSKGDHVQKLPRMEFGVPKHSKLEPNHCLAKRDGNPS